MYCNDIGEQGKWTGKENKGGPKFFGGGEKKKKRGQRTFISQIAKSLKNKDWKGRRPERDAGKKKWGGEHLGG